MKFLAASFLFIQLLFPASTFALDPISVGLILELSGPSAAIGHLCRGGYETARAVYIPDGRVAGRLVKLVYGDSQGSPAKALSEFRRMLDVEKVAAVISTTSALTAPLNPLSKQTKVPLLSRASYASLLDENQFAYRFWPNSLKVGEALAKEVISRGEKSIAILTFEDDFNLTMEKGFLQALQRSSVRVPFSEHVSNLDSTGPVLAARISASGAESLFVNLGYSSTGTFIRKVREAGFTGQIYSLVWLSVVDVLKQIGPRAGAGAIYIDIDYSKPEFAKAFEKHNLHSKPNNAAYVCYLELITILEAIKRNSDFSSPEELHLEIFRLDKIPTLDGSVSFDNREAGLELVSRTVPDQYLEDAQ